MLHTIKLLLIVMLLVPVVAIGQNRPPVVDAGPDQYVFTNDNAILTGTATDPDNDSIVEWLWAVDSAPAGSSPYLSDPTRYQIVSRGDTAGEYDISLVASDGLVWSDPDNVSVFVADLLAPTAVATADTTSGVSPLTVQFDGSGSLDGQISDGTSIFDIAGTGWDDGSFSGDLLYGWEFGDQTGLSYEVSPTHTYDSPGTYTAVLIVSDGAGQSSLDTINITVNAVPVPPAVWLFGSGLLGLVGVARRRGKTT